MVRLIEVLVALYCVIGMLTGEPALTYFGIGISLVAQVLSLVSLFGYKSARIPRVPLVFYVINMVVLSLIVAILLLQGDAVGATLNRGLSLLSIFGLSILFCMPQIRVGRIIRIAINLFTGLGVVIILDSVSYLSIGASIWPPEMYLGDRFAGPFFDPNFLSITYAILFIIVLLGHYSSTRMRLIRLIIFSIIILLGGSWNAVGLLCISLILGKIIHNKNYGKKQIVILVAYLIALPVLLVNFTPLYDTFEATVANFGIEPPEASAKFKSFEYRIVAQNDALNGITENPLGHGPQSLVPEIGRDTHNSYIGFTYELGVLGLGLLLLNMTYRRSGYSHMNNVLTTFFFFIALTINIHYSSMYFMLLLIINTGQNWEMSSKGSGRQKLSAKGA